MSIMNLPQPIEARFLRVNLVNFTGHPCIRLELMGCQKQDCNDINECLDNNGGCQQKCLNRYRKFWLQNINLFLKNFSFFSPGGFNCMCNVGYELFTEDGTSEYFIPGKKQRSKMSNYTKKSTQLLLFQSLKMVFVMETRTV